MCNRQQTSRNKRRDLKHAKINLHELITKSSELSKLDPFMSADGSLCVDGPFGRHASMMAENVRQCRSPDVLLLKRNHIVNLIIRHCALLELQLK